MIKGQTTMLLLVNFAKLVSDLVDLLVFLEFVCLSSCTVKFFCLSVIRLLAAVLQAVQAHLVYVSKVNTQYGVGMIRPKLVEK